MTSKPEALRLADALERMSLSTVWDKQAAAAELRRLHEENIQARRTSEHWKAEHVAGNKRIAALEALNAEVVAELENCVDVLAMLFSAAPVDSCIGSAIKNGNAVIAKTTGEQA